MKEQDLVKRENRELKMADGDSNIGLPCPDGSSLYRIYFRESSQQFTAFAAVEGLKRGELVMVKQEHGLEPAVIVGSAPQSGCKNVSCRVLYEISRVGRREEYEKFASLLLYEKRAYSFCHKLVAQHGLKMRLVRVERFFNDS